MPTIISTTTDEWKTVEWDEESQEWQTVDSGHIVFESWGDAPKTPCAYQPQGAPPQFVIENHD